MSANECKCKYEIGQVVYLLMTYGGKERCKHEGDFDNWFFEGYVDNIKGDTITVKIFDDVKSEYCLNKNTFRFSIKNNYSQISKNRPDYKLFDNRVEAIKYERESRYNRNYRRGYRGQNIGIDAFAEERKEKKEQREAKKLEIEKEKKRKKQNAYQSHYRKVRYLADPEYKARVNERNRKYYADNPEYKERIVNKRREKRKDPEYREREKERERENYRKNSKKINEKARERYANDPVLREKNKQRMHEYYIRKRDEKKVAQAQLQMGA